MKTAITLLPVKAGNKADNVMSRQVHAKTDSEWEKALLDKNVHYISTMNGPIDYFLQGLKSLSYIDSTPFTDEREKTTLIVPLTCAMITTSVLQHGP